MAVESKFDFKKNLLGNGIISPLRRLASSDFVAGSNEALIRSAINQILITKPGELPWRPNFGTNIETFRHKNMSDADLGMLKDDIVNAVLTYEPRVTTAKCDVTVSEGKIEILLGDND